MATKETELEKVEEQTQDAEAWASAVQVVNPTAWRAARERRAGYKKLDDSLDEHFKKMKRPWDEGKQKILDEEKRLRGPVATAIANLDHKILDYEKDFFRERAHQQRLLNERERQKAIEDRKWEAAALRGDGDETAAEALESQPLYVPTLVIPEFTDWVEGESRQDYWSCDVHTFSELVKAVAAGEQPLSLLLPNQTALNMMARAQHESMNIPGCRARSRKGIVQRNG